MERIKQLSVTEHKFSTVVIDSLDWLEQLIWQEVCKERGVDAITDINWGKGYGSALTYWQQLLLGLSYLRDSCGMAITMLAHADIKRFESPDTESYDRYQPRLHKDASAIVQEWCDEVFFASWKVYTRKEDAGFNKEKAKGIGGDERIIRTTEKPFAVAKNRLGMPDEVEMKWSVYQGYQSKGE